MKILSIGDIVTTLAPMHLGPAIVVDIIKAEEVPNPNLITKYYEFNSKETAMYPGAYRSTRMDRYILQRPNRRYIVLPATALYLVR